MELLDLGDDLTYPTLEELSRFAFEQADAHPTAYFIIRHISQSLIDEYQGQAIPEARFKETSVLLAFIKRVLADPEDINALNDLVVNSRIRCGVL